MSEIADRVKNIVVDKLGVDADKVTETASFTTDLNADSLDTVELIMDFEKEFGRQVICRHSNSNTEAAANNPAVFVYISPF